jgi:hypothetical protein
MGAHGEGLFAPDNWKAPQNIRHAGTFLEVPRERPDRRTRAFEEQIPTDASATAPPPNSDSTQT